MVLILMGYFLNFVMYAIAIFLALLLMEKIGKKRHGTWQERSSLSVLWAAGAIMVQLIARALSYLGFVSIK